MTLGAIYKVIPDETDKSSIRVIDNEGEDYLYIADRFEPVQMDAVHQDITETVTVHVDPVIKGVLRAEALAAQTSLSALLRAWIDEHLDLPAPLYPQETR